MHLDFTAKLYTIAVGHSLGPNLPNHHSKRLLQRDIKQIDALPSKNQVLQC